MTESIDSNNGRSALNEAIDSYQLGAADCLLESREKSNS